MSNKYSLLLYTVTLTASIISVEGLSAKSKQVLQAKILPVFLKCCDEFNFSMDEIAEIKRHKKNIESKNACFYACLLKRTELRTGVVSNVILLKRTRFIDENGLLSEEGAHSSAKKLLSDEEDLNKSQELMHECAAVNNEPVSDGKKGCDRAMLVMNCLLKKADKFGLTP
nr:Uncharacterized protein/Odorant-binding related protein [Metisa plana]